MKYTTLVILAALVATAGCITPAAEVVYVNQTPNVVYITATQTPTPDPCSGVVCTPTCIGCDLYNTICIDGHCMENALLQEHSPSCGCITSEPEPTATPDHNPRPSQSATPPPSPTATPTPYPSTTVIDIDRPIYQGDVRNNGRIIDIRVSPDPLIVGKDINIDVDVLNTGTETSQYGIKCDVRRGWQTIDVGDTATQSFKNMISESGDYTWYINLYYDPNNIRTDVLLQNATVDVHYYAEAE